MSAVDTILELSRERLKDQSDTLRHIMTKASIMLGISAVVATGNIPAGAHEAVTYQSVLLVCMYLSVGVCGIYGLYAIFPRIYWEGPDIQRADEVLRTHEHGDAREWIAQANIMACEHNAKHLSRIGTALSLGVIFLALSVVLRVAVQLTHPV